MVAGQHPCARRVTGVKPSVTVLQLDTQFPRIAGDIGSPETFACPVEVVRISGAHVAKIVTAHPENIDLTLFEKAMETAKGDLIATSCGFLSPFQKHLSEKTSKSVVTSSLIALPLLSQLFQPNELSIVTFDETKLNNAHLQGCSDYQSSVVGLANSSHLRRVIEDDRATLDRKQAETDVVDCVKSVIQTMTKAILLECTNLPPYKAALMGATGLPVYDVLSVIENMFPGAICNRFKGPALPPLKGI